MELMRFVTGKKIQDILEKIGHQQLSLEDFYALEEYFSFKHYKGRGTDQNPYEFIAPYTSFYPKTVTLSGMNTTKAYRDEQHSEATIRRAQRYIGGLLIYLWGKTNCGIIARTNQNFYTPQRIIGATEDVTRAKWFESQINTIIYNKIHTNIDLRVSKSKSIEVAIGTNHDKHINPEYVNLIKKVLTDSGITRISVNEKKLDASSETSLSAQLHNEIGLDTIQLSLSRELILGPEKEENPDNMPVLTEEGFNNMLRLTGAMENIVHEVNTLNLSLKR